MIIIMIMKNNTISTDELRVNFAKLIKAMKNKQSLVLTYRNQPLARLEPILPVADEPESNDSFYMLREISEPLGTLSAGEIDHEIYGR
jgi:antitoxin (DNA-binding transcriptional repressor) of toxin-antitoxin stability system